MDHPRKVPFLDNRLANGVKVYRNVAEREDDLVDELHPVYSGALSTTYQAYKKAQAALKQMEDMTFTDEEIDAFLPKELKKGQYRSQANAVHPRGPKAGDYG